MQSSIQTSAQYAELLGDQELIALLCPEAELEALISVEITLASAQAQAQLGLIPVSTGEQPNCGFVRQLKTCVAVGSYALCRLLV